MTLGLAKSRSDCCRVDNSWKNHKKPDQRIASLTFECGHSLRRYLEFRLCRNCAAR
jgi:hypothetical protein